MLRALVIAAVPLAAFLAFAIQPMMGKRLLPLYGGAPGTWLGSMLYFQLALLLGYSWAAWLVRKRIALQAGLTALLGLAAILTFHLPSDDADAPASIGRVVLRLAGSTLPAMVLLFSTSPLMHGWLKRRGQDVPYYLYAISNAGSFTALLLYPFYVERHLYLSDQKHYWHGGLIITAGLLAAAGYILTRSARDDASFEPVAHPVEPVAFSRVALWLWLSAVTCVGMLGATYHLSAEIGSNPIAWIGPFGAYLLSFSATFSSRWRRWMTLTTIAWLAISLTEFMVNKGFNCYPVNGWRAFWLLSLTTSGSFLGNALLYSVRPAQRFERFYLILAAGGVLGGLLSAVVIPRLFPLPIEFALASAALLTTGMIWLVEDRKPSVIIITTCVVLSPVLGLGYWQSKTGLFGDAPIANVRDLYGHLVLQTTSTLMALSSDTTLHGSQLITNQTDRRHPTTYYSESSGVGRVLEKFRAGRPTMKVGVIGLGAGTLAAYSRQGDVYDFWDIDPKAIRIARQNFFYVADAAGRINLIQRDGRKALEQSTTDYDVIVIDAFTGDGIPSHLITSEALAVYLRRLSVRNGLLLIHVSSRYSKTFPVVEMTARTLGQFSLDVLTYVIAAKPDRDLEASPSEYIIICAPQRLKSIAEWFPGQEDNGRVKRSLASTRVDFIDPQLVWSDERNATLDSLQLTQLLFPFRP
jgi:hypothetical protein